MAHENAPRPFSAGAMLPLRIIPTTTAPVSVRFGEVSLSPGALYPMLSKEREQGALPVTLQRPESSHTAPGGYVPVMPL